MGFHVSLGECILFGCWTFLGREKLELHPNNALLSLRRVFRIIPDDTSVS